MNLTQHHVQGGALGLLGLPAPNAPSVESQVIVIYGQHAGEETIVLQCGRFQCAGNGLLYEGVEREEPDALKDLLIPTKTSGCVRIQDNERPKKWWKAQCLHYGLPVPAAASIRTYRVYLQDAIQRRSLKRPQGLVNLEVELKKDFARRMAEIKYREAKSGMESKPSPTKARFIEYESESEEIQHTTAKRRKTEDDSKRHAKKARREVRPEREVVHAQAQALSIPRNLLETVDMNVLSRSTGAYELDCSYSSRSGQPVPPGFVSTLVIYQAQSSYLRFEGFIKLPTIMYGVLRLVPEGPIQDDGCVPLGFEWCGRKYGREVNLIPSPSKFGRLRLNIRRRLIQGTIQGYGEFSFSGYRVERTQLEVDYRWEDFETRSLEGASRTG